VSQRKQEREGQGQARPDGGEADDFPDFPDPGPEREPPQAPARRDGRPAHYLPCVCPDQVCWPCFNRPCVVCGKPTGSALIQTCTACGMTLPDDPPE
jgi:hypothetical protein